MDLHDYVELIALLFWVICAVSGYVLGRVHFKNKRLEKLRLITSNLMKSYIRIYDQENLSDEKKINRVGNAVVDGLKSKGFKLNEQEVEDIFAAVAKQINSTDEAQDK
ncbi:MAG: hypothetical protein ACLUCZ_17480 [Thomasclavelia ramosa]|uniref:Helveticin ORF 2 n=1 Tax=Lactobacillus kalixensis DSM 16043 TaxID=1423763 RepID=A0A0R1U053_9LACO|nr:hypothetical protein [Lactobacillus kalixensis]KRL86710.1 helveticin ORF 2 [Lactobacillus kalixensis DSM 16043]